MRKNHKRKWHILCAVMALVLMISNIPILDVHAEIDPGNPVITEQPSDSNGETLDDEGDKSGTDLGGKGDKKTTDPEKESDIKLDGAEKKKTEEEEVSEEPIVPKEEAEEQPVEVKAFLEAVDALWNSDSVNKEEMQGLIQAADDAYEALTEEQQAMEDVKVAVLTEEVRAYLDAVLALWDIEDADEQAAALEKISELYDALTDEQKETVLVKAVQEALGLLDEIEPLVLGTTVYVSANGSDTDGDGTKENPFASLAVAVDKIDEEAEKAYTIELLSDLEATKCARINGKDITIKGNGHKITRGDDFAQIQDNARSTYNPAMIEVCNSDTEKTASLYLENITLDDREKTAGTKYSQASTESKGGNGDIVQDGIIATYDGVGTITLGKDVTLTGYGGMSAVRLSGGTLIMEEGSVITGGKNFTTKGDGFGPAGAVWIQGGTFTMEEGAKIDGVMGRAVYVDSGSATINGTIRDVVLNPNMWNDGGTAIHVRNGAKVTLGGTVGNASGTKLPGNAIEVINENSIFTMLNGSSIQNIARAIRIVGGTVHMEEGSIIKKGSAGIFAEGGVLQMNGTITELVDDDSHVMQLCKNAKVIIGSTGYITKNIGGYGAVYLQEGTVDIYGHIDENYVNQRGGGIGGTNHSDNCYVTLYEGGTINNNYSHETGGGIMMSKGVFTMKGGTISGNIAKEEGGGVFIRQQGSFIMEGGEITNNVSGGYGGGVAYKSGGGYIDLRGGTISNNRMNATVDSNPKTWNSDIYNVTVTATGGVPNDLSIASDGTGTVNSYLCISPDMTVDHNVFMITNNKTVTVTDGTKIGNAGGSDIHALKVQGSKWGFGVPVATLWTQNANVTSVTISGLSLDNSNPVWVLVKNNDNGEITRIPASLNAGVVSFQAPATTNGCALAVVQPAAGDVYVNLTTTLTRIVENNLPTEIPYQAAYGLKEDAGEDVLSGAENLEVTFLLRSGEEIGKLGDGNKAFWDAVFNPNDFKAGENIVAGAVLTFKTNGKDYIFYSNSVSIPMLAVYTVSFDSNGGSSVAAQVVVDGDSVSRPTDPTRAGYTFNGWTLGGAAYDFTTPVTGNITLTAQWTANPTTGGGGGTTGGGGGTTGGGGGTTPVTTPPAPEVVPIAAPAVPLAAPAVVVATPAAPEVEEPAAEVEDEEVPLAAPEEPEEEEEAPLVEMEEPEVPLASGAQWALLNLLLMILTVIGGVVMAIGATRKKEEYDEDNEESRKNSRLLHLFGIVPAIVSAIVFFLTEDMRSPMVFVDKMTVTMICITVVEAAAMVLAYRARFAAKNEQE